MPTWWGGRFFGVYLGGTLKTPGVERSVPRWWEMSALSIWNAEMPGVQDYFRAQR